MPKFRYAVVIVVAVLVIALMVITAHHHSRRLAREKVVSQLARINERAKRDQALIAQEFRDGLECDKGSRAFCTRLTHDYELERQYQQQDWAEDHPGK